jgi:hypothetical protein
MFNVTLINLSPDARTVVADSGPVNLGSIPAGELTRLLETFVGIDALQNSKADPEIRVQVRRDRFIVRTSNGKLILQDARNLSEPAYVLSAGEIIAELDGSAAARRTAPPIPLPSQFDSYSANSTSPATGTELPPPVVVEPSWPWALIGLVLLLAGYIGYAEWTGRAASAAPALAPLTQAERQAEDAVLTGVYTTGSAPGQHGIILLGDGKLKLYRTFAQAAPGVVYGTYRLGRLDAKIALSTDQPGGLITVRDRDTLEFCGELYRRVP